MEEYINGCYTKYGTRPLSESEIKYKGRMLNGMWCVIGYIDDPKDGISIDVYRDEKLTDLVFIEHGYRVGNMPKDMGQWSTSDFEFLKMNAELRCQEMRI